MVVNGRLLNSGEVHKAFAVWKPAGADRGDGDLEGKKENLLKKSTSKYTLNLVFQKIRVNRSFFCKSAQFFKKVLASFEASSVEIRVLI